MTGKSEGFLCCLALFTKSILLGGNHGVAQYKTLFHISECEDLIVKRYSIIIKVGLKNGSPDAKPIQLNTKAFRDFVSFDQYFNLAIHFKYKFDSAYKNNFRKKNIFTGILMRKRP